MQKNVYIFSGEPYMVRRSLKKLRDSLDISYPEMNISEFKTMPKTEEIIEACNPVPFMSSNRLVILYDCTVLTSKGSAEEAKKIAAYLGKMPETTALAFCTGDSPDKRRALYQEVKKSGEAMEFPAPERPDCVSFVIKTVKEMGAAITSKAASDLVDIVGRDYYSLENEAAKLAAFSGYGEITPADVAECVSKSLEYNVFEIHGLLLNAGSPKSRETFLGDNKQAEKAEKLLEDILKNERPEGLVGLLARKIRDMYKVKTMIDLGYSPVKIAGTMGISGYVAEIISRECRAFTQQELRAGLVALADLDYSIKSGEGDALLKLTETLFKIYKIN
jgi:DNA polymerase III subunit delta